MSTMRFCLLLLLSVCTITTHSETAPDHRPIFDQVPSNILSQERPPFPAQEQGLSNSFLGLQQHNMPYDEYGDDQSVRLNIGGQGGDWDYHLDSEEQSSGRFRSIFARENPNRIDMLAEFETSSVTDIFCWIGNSRISHTCALERCDYWLTYNATKSPRGFACLQARYTVDGLRYSYRNCVQTISSFYDPCEQVVLGADNPRVNVTSCDICWDNGCNMNGYRNIWYNNSFVPHPYRYRSPSVTSWAWFSLLLMFMSAFLFCIFFLCRKFFACDCDKQLEPYYSDRQASCEVNSETVC